MIIFEIKENILKEESEKTQQKISFIYSKLTMFLTVLVNFFLLIIYLYLISYNYYLSKTYSNLVNKMKELDLNYKIFASKLTTYYSKDYIKKQINKNYLYLPLSFVFLYSNEKILIVK